VREKEHYEIKLARYIQTDSYINKRIDTHTKREEELEKDIK